MVTHVTGILQMVMHKRFIATLYLAGAAQERRSLQEKPAWSALRALSCVRRPPTPETQHPRPPAHLQTHNSLASWPKGMSGHRQDWHKCPSPLRVFVVRVLLAVHGSAEPRHRCTGIDIAPTPRHGRSTLMPCQDNSAALIQKHLETEQSRCLICRMHKKEPG